MRELFESASRTRVLNATLVTVLVLLVAVFPALPIGGEMLDVRAGYTYPEAVAAMESYWRLAYVPLAMTLATASAVRRARHGYRDGAS